MFCELLTIENQVSNNIPSSNLEIASHVTNTFLKNMVEDNFIFSTMQHATRYHMRNFEVFKLKGYGICRTYTHQ